MAMTTTHLEAHDPCPCGGGLYGDCCGPALDGGHWPTTAETLMRSRYSAFVLHRWPWLVETHDPRTRGQMTPDEVKVATASLNWTGLEVQSAVAGGTDDAQGHVAFIARYLAPDGQPGALQERSRFRRHSGRWVYVDGTQPGATAAGRNDPCPCGSGQKYKRCCGHAA